MARYDIESDVQFAQKQLDTSRKYKADQAKQQEKFAKNLFAFDTVAQGLNLLVKNAGKENDEKQLPKKAAYNNILKRTETIRNDENLRLQSGTGVEDYLEKKYFDILNTEASETFSQLSPAQYTKALRLEAKNLAVANADEYKQMVQMSMEMPEFENFDEYYKQASGTPRSIGEWATKGVKRLFSKETPETIKIKNNKASDALYGTEMFDKFETLSSSLKAYDTVTNKGLDAVKIINKLNLKSGGLNEGQTKIDTRTVEDKVRGIKKEVTTIYGATNKLDGSGVEYLPENIVVIDTHESILDDNRVTATDINNIYDLTKSEHHTQLADILNNAEGRPTYAQYQKAREYLATNPEAYKIDFRSESDMERAFPAWQSSQIITAKNKDGQRIARDVNRDGIFEIDPDFMDDAIAMGLDEKTLKDQYKNLGSQVNVKILSPAQLMLQNKKPLATMIPKTSEDEYNTMLTDPTSDLYEVLNFQLKKKSNQGKDVIELGVQDLSVLFPTLGITGKQTLYWDVENKQLFF